MAHHPIAVAMTIAVNAVPKAARAAVVQIAPPKLDHRVGRVATAAPNVVVVKRVAQVVVDQKPPPNHAAPVAKDALKVDPMLVQNVLVQNVVDQAAVVPTQPPNRAALVAKVRQKVDETLAQNVDAMNAVRKLDRMDLDDAALALARIAPNLLVAARWLNAAPDADDLISEPVRMVLVAVTPGVLKHTAVVLAVVR